MNSLWGVLFLCTPGSFCYLHLVLQPMASETLRFVCTEVATISDNDYSLSVLDNGESKYNNDICPAIWPSEFPIWKKNTLWEEGGFRYNISCWTWASWLSALPVSIHKPKSHFWRLGNPLAKGLSVSAIIFITEGGSTNYHSLHSLSLLTTELLSMSASDCPCCTAAGLGHLLQKE